MNSWLTYYAIAGMNNGSGPGPDDRTVALILLTVAAFLPIWLFAGWYQKIRYPRASEPWGEAFVQAMLIWAILVIGWGSIWAVAVLSR